MRQTEYPSLNTLFVNSKDWWTVFGNTQVPLIHPERDLQSGFINAPYLAEQNYCVEAKNII